MQAGELAAEVSSSSPSSASSLDEAKGFYIRAFKAFEEAVARASSEEGDDLPALLLNWGVAQHSAFTKLHGEKEKNSSPPPSSDTSSLLSSPLFLLEAAEARLRESASFGRGDPSPLCALGDVLCDRAASSSDGGDGESAPGPLYRMAISDGYDAALAIDRRCAAASAGKGDALLALSRLASASASAASAASAAAGDAAASSASSVDLAKEAARAYSNALAEAPRLGGLDERGSVIYNAACASARAAALSSGEGEREGEAGETALEGARRRVRLLVAGGAVSAREVLKDEDLSFLRQERWLLEVASAEEAAERSPGDAMRE